MDDEELRIFRASFDEASLQLMVVIYMFELYGMAFFATPDSQVGLTPDGRELAKLLFKEEKYRNCAVEQVDSARKNSSREDWRQNYIN